MQVDSSSKGKKVSIENKKSQIDISSNIVKDKIKNIAFTPRPYRITIKLSGANPSAPAETVTNALRKAGVKFEVERIERVNLQDSIKVFPLDSRSKQQ